MAMDDRDVAFFFFCGHSDTGLDLVNTADFSLVSIQPYELAYHAHPFHRTINNLYHILLLYTYRRTPYHLFYSLVSINYLSTNNFFKALYILKTLYYIDNNIIKFTNKSKSPLF